MRSSLNGKIKGLGSYGKYGRASSYPGQRNKRRQKVSTQVHAGQLEKVREGVPNRSIHIWLASYWQLTPIKRALGHSLDIMGRASNYVHCEELKIAISKLDFTENFKVLGNFSLRNSTLASKI